VLTAGAIARLRGNASFCSKQRVRASRRYGTFQGSDEVPILAGVAGQKAYQALCCLRVRVCGCVCECAHARVRAFVRACLRACLLAWLAHGDVTSLFCAVLACAQRKLFRRRCAWGIGISLGFVVMMVSPRSPPLSGRVCGAVRPPPPAFVSLSAGRLCTSTWACPHLCCNFPAALRLTPI
jgi:hypothetical protein